MSEFKVLVVDDEDTVVVLVQDILELLAVDFASFQTAADALIFLQKQKVGLIISDVNLPDMNGIRFYQRAVTHSPELAGKFIFTSGLPPRGELKNIIDTTQSKFIQKPFSIPAFQTIVQGFIP